MASTIFDIAAFKASVADSGFVQTNKYAVYITPSAKLNGLFVNTPDDAQTFKNMTSELQYRCISASLPGMILRTVDNNRLGLGIMEKMPFGAAYTDVDLTFLCDRFGDAYNFWYAWLNYIFASVGRDSSGGTVDKVTPGNNPSGKREYYTAEYKDNYAATVDIVVYDNYGLPSTEYKLYKAYPVSINDSPLGWGDNNNLLKLTVKITFREWAIDEGNVTIQQSNTASNTSVGNVFTPT